MRLFALTSRPVYVGVDSASGRQVAAPTPPMPSSSAPVESGGDRRLAPPPQHHQETRAAPASADEHGDDHQLHDGVPQVLGDPVDDAGEPDRVVGQGLGADLVDALQLDVQAQRPVEDVGGQRAQRGDGDLGAPGAGADGEGGVEGADGRGDAGEEQDGDQRADQRQGDPRRPQAGDAPAAPPRRRRGRGGSASRQAMSAAADAVPRTAGQVSPRRARAGRSSAAR